ncbi:MAG: helix-turn-helix transcriptional regulator, partial [Bacteroidota bacterium]
NRKTQVDHAPSSSIWGWRYVCLKVFRVFRDGDWWERAGGEITEQWGRSMAHDGGSEGDKSPDLFGEMPATGKAKPPQRKAIPVGPPKPEEDAVRFPNNPVINGLLRAIHHTGQYMDQLFHEWAPDSGGGMTFTYDPRPTTTKVEVRLPPVPGAPDLAALNPDFTRAILFALLSFAVEAVNNPTATAKEDRIQITIGQIEDFFSYTRRGTDRERFRDEIRQSIKFIELLALRVSRVKSGPGGNRTGSISGNVFDVLTYSEEELRTGGVVVGDTSKAAAWSIRAGQWADLYLSREGAMYIASLAHSYIRPKGKGGQLTVENFLQRMVTQSYMFLRSMRAIPGREHPIRVSTMLESIGYMLNPEALRGDRRLGGKILDRFQEALGQLQPENSPPVVARLTEAAEEALSYRGRNRNERAHKAVVHLSLPAREGDSPAAVPKSKPATSRATSSKPAAWSPETGAQLRSLRLKLGKSQEDVARALGINRAHLAKLEKGANVPRPALFRAVIAWIRDAEDQERNG